MSNYSFKIEKYLGRKVDFINDVELVSDGVSTKITKWNVEEAEPTIKELDKIDISVELAEFDVNFARQDAYLSWQEQMDMQYWDQVNGTTTWKDAIAKVKSDNPKE